MIEHRVQSAVSSQWSLKDLAIFWALRNAQLASASLPQSKQGYHVRIIIHIVGLKNRHTSDHTLTGCVPTVQENLRQSMQSQPISIRSLLAGHPMRVHRNYLSLLHSVKATIQPVIYRLLVIVIHNLDTFSALAKTCSISCKTMSMHIGERKTLITLSKMKANGNWESSWLKILLKLRSPSS